MKRKITNKIIKTSIVFLFIIITVFAMLFLTDSGMNIVPKAKAALTYYNDQYQAPIHVNDIGVSVLENGEIISHRDYDSGEGNLNQDEGIMFNELKSSILPGKTYQEELAAKNSGTIDQYVRVKLYRFWIDSNGNKRQELAPEFIKLNGLAQNGWVIDESGSGRELVALYYTKPLEAGKTSPCFLDSFTIDESVLTKMLYTEKEVAENTTIITMNNPYKNMKINILCEIDAVQTHNPVDTILSAWGRKVKLDPNDKTLSFVD